MIYLFNSTFILFPQVFASIWITFYVFKIVHDLKIFQTMLSSNFDPTIDSICHWSSKEKSLTPSSKTANVPSFICWVNALCFKGIPWVMPTTIGLLVIQSLLDCFLIKRNSWDFIYFPLLSSNFLLRAKGEHFVLRLFNYSVEVKHIFHLDYF